MFEQSQLPAEAQTELYSTLCANATGLPLSSDTFNDCIVGYSRGIDSPWLLIRNGTLEIVWFSYQQIGVRWDSAYSELDDAWHRIESFMDDKIEAASMGVQNVYSSSADFWWYDTNGAIQKTAYGGVIIALAAATAVLLVSTRSLEISLFGLVSIAFILFSVIAILVASGWTLGL